MEREGRFHLPLRTIREYVRAVLFAQNDFNARSEFGQEVFSQYSSGRAGFSTESTAKAIRENFGSTEHEVIDRVIDCCTFSLGVLQRNDRYYRFSHQHIRDYRSSRIAIYHIGTMVLIAEIEFDLWHPRVLAYSDHEVLLHKSDDTILCYRITEGRIVLARPITIAPGLDVMGVDLRQLHPECNYTPEQMRILRQYGANI